VQALMEGTIVPLAISINFEIFISTNEIFLIIHYYPSQYFLPLEEIIFENFQHF
jgi:hypothetical protein